MWVRPAENELEFLWGLRGNNCFKNQTLIINGVIYFLLLSTLRILRQETSVHFTQFAAINWQQNVSKGMKLMQKPQKSDVMQKTRVVIMNLSLFFTRLIGSRGQECVGSCCVCNPATNQLCDPKGIRQILLPVFAESIRAEAGPVASWHGSLSVWCARGLFCTERNYTSHFPGVLLVLQPPLFYYVCALVGKMSSKLSFRPAHRHGGNQPV